MKTQNVPFNANPVLQSKINWIEHVKKIQGEQETKPSTNITGKYNPVHLHMTDWAFMHTLRDNGSWTQDKTTGKMIWVELKFNTVLVPHKMIKLNDKPPGTETVTKGDWSLSWLPWGKKQSTS